MADMTAMEKRTLERLFGMQSGYVLNFSNQTFQSFILDSVRRDIYDSKYDYGSGSKANRLRAFWQVESNQVVIKLLNDLIEYGQIESLLDNEKLVELSRKIVSRLAQSGAVEDLDALAIAGSERDFDVVAKAVRDAIENNESEAGLDRLHTFTTKYIRKLCEKHGLTVSRDRPLHSLFGEYVKQLRKTGDIESETTERILKSSIAIMDSFNHVRNNRSLAHDNVLLSYDKALLIFNHVASSIRFVNTIESRNTRTE